MATTHHHNSLSNILTITALTAASILSPVAANATQAPSTPAPSTDTSALAKYVDLIIKHSEPLGELNGNAYYFAPNPQKPSQGTFYKISTNDSSAMPKVPGVIENHRIVIVNAPEAGDLMNVIGKRSVDDILNGAGSLQQTSSSSQQQPPVKSPSSFQQAQTSTTSPSETGPSDGTVVKQANGGVEVQFTQGPYTGSVMDFSRAADLITIKNPDGSTAELSYYGIAKGGNKLWGATKAAYGIGLGGIGKGGAMTVPGNYYIDESAGGKHIVFPTDSPMAEQQQLFFQKVVAGAELAQQKAGITVPAMDKLRKLANGPSH